MSKSLVIVESPAKAKTINRYLGDAYIVKSSVGHVRDLPTGRKAKGSAKASKPRKKTVKQESREAKAHSQLIARLGVDPEDNWRANYEILPDKEPVVAELRKLAKSADSIFLATDMDREGEAIAWHVREVIGGNPDRYRRVVFNEITQKAIQEAFKNPTSLNMDRVNAQQARRFLDRVVGFMLSPLLWAKVARGLSAGRVQSVAVRLIVEREREIQAFIPEEYWDLFVHLWPSAVTDKKASDEPLSFEVVEKDGKKWQPTNEAETMKAVAALKQAKFILSKREYKADKNNRPGPPFITSTLQQAASTNLGFSVKRTMGLAQRLYEAGYITYMRTDSTNVSADAITDVRKLILSDYGERYLPSKARVYTSKKRTQEAHEAIRPSDVRNRPSSGRLTGMDEPAHRLYELIWRQFVACQMPPAEYDLTTLTVTASDYSLRIRGRVQKFDGYMRVRPQTSKNKEDRQLPELNEGDELSLESMKPSQHFTKPPARYREASLVQKLEKSSIGRPSTYASIISTIQDRGYVSLRDKRFYAEKIGTLVTDRLTDSFERLMDYQFTASLEEQLDKVAEGSILWRTALNEFYQDFTSKLKAAEQGMRQNTPVNTGIACPDCGRKLAVRTASMGIFLGCEGYSLPAAEKCSKTVNLVAESEMEGIEQEEDDSRLPVTKRKCPICKNAMDVYLVDEQRRLHLCTNSPDCAGLEVEAGHFKVKTYQGPLVECDKCKAEMRLESGRFGKYFKCSNDACTNTRKVMRNGEPAPPKMDPVDIPELRCQRVDDHYVLRDGMAGLFLAASKFPKHRETRAPLVRELLSHQNEIDPKYSFLWKGPTEDPDGNPAIIRFSRKSSEHYLMSEKNGKPAGWRAYYKNGQWQAVHGRQTKPAGRKSKKKS